MATTKMTEFIPDKWIGTLKELGKSDCIKITKHPILDAIKSTVAWDEFDSVVSDPGLRNFGRYAFRSFGYEGIQLFAYAKFLTNGPKIVQPSNDDCVGLNRVDARISISDYQQPFPTMLIEIPEDYQKRMTDEYGTRCPNCVLLMHDPDVPLLAIFAINNPASEIVLISNHQPEKSIEAVLRETTLDDAGYRQSINLNRIAVNLALLLTNIGFVDAGPLDPKRFTRNKKLLKSKSTIKRIRARKQLDQMINLIRIEQEITWSNRASATGLNPLSGGTSKSPHWRRGHIRRQRFGVGRTEERLIFVKPVFINSSQFAGQASDTEYRIKVDRQGEEDKFRPSECKRRTEQKIDQHDDRRRKAGH